METRVVVNDIWYILKKRQYKGSNNVAVSQIAREMNISVWTIYSILHRYDKRFGKE